MAAHILDALGVADKVTLELNTLGDTESRQSYRTKLVGYLEGFKDKLSEDSLARLDRNPLRILDSKDQGDRAVIADAPLLSKSVGGVVYVIESRGVPVRGVNMSLDRLRDSRATLLGGVLTKFDDEAAAGYGYGYGYGYGLKYGRTEDEAA